MIHPEFLEIIRSRLSFHLLIGSKLPAAMLCQQKRWMGGVPMPSLSPFPQNTFLNLKLLTITCKIPNRIFTQLILPLFSHPSCQMPQLRFPPTLNRFKHKAICNTCFTSIRTFLISITKILLTVLQILYGTRVILSPTGISESALDSNQKKK